MINILFEEEILQFSSFFAELHIYKQEQHELVVCYLEDVAFPRGANYCV